MYLDLLNEDLKKLFISFAYKLTLVDSVFLEQEEDLLKRYCEEMNLEFDLKRIKEINSSFDELKRIEFIVDKKIFIVELIALAMCDDNYADEEKQFIEQAITVLGLSKDFEDTCIDLLNAYFDSENKLNEHILKI